MYKLFTIAKKKSKSPILPIRNALNPDFKAQNLYQKKEIKKKENSPKNSQNIYAVKKS